MVGRGISWSPYVIGSLVVVWIWCVGPFIWSRNKPLFWLSLDSVTLIGFLYFIERLSPEPGWFLDIALPICLTVSIILLVLVYLFRRRILRQLYKAAGLLISACLLSLVLEFFIDRYLFSSWQPGWSLLVTVGCAALSIVAIVLQRRQWIVEEIRFWLRM